LGFPFCQRFEVEIHISGKYIYQPRFDCFARPLTAHHAAYLFALTAVYPATKAFVDCRMSLLIKNWEQTMPRVIKRSVFLVAWIFLFSACADVIGAQNTSKDLQPIIDVHHHAMDNDNGFSVGPTCPNTSKFTSSDPKTDAGQDSGWVKEECTPKLYPAAKGEYMKDVLAEMERLNVTAVTFGDPKIVQKWKDAAPERIIPGTSFQNGMAPGQRVALDELRKDFTSGGFKVMGEIGLQYEGISPSDPSVEAYFALAEELDVPVAIHMGTGGSGRANVMMPKFRGSMGNPILLEELLARHPKLRVQVMHAGYPMIDNMLTLLQANSHVYVDVAGLIWSYPIKEVNRYIERLVDAGFEDRVMFGTDQLIWPKLMAYSISIIQNADYLTPQQKRDILYNNAARFLRIDTAQAK